MTDAPWSVELARTAQRDMRRLDSPVRQRIEGALRRLAANDPAVAVRKLKGRDEWRLRVGDWRVRFQRDTSTRTIFVTRVLPRGRAYER